MDAASNSAEIRWYRSNSSGMALEMINSRVAATRNEYSLSVQTINPTRLPGLLPPIIRPYYDVAYRVELRLLHEYGKEIRRQWIFRDGSGMARIAASGSAGFFDRDNPPSTDPGDEDPELGDSKEQKNSGFIEIRNYEGLVTREFQFDDDLAEWDFLYFYRENSLLRTETWFKEAPAPPVSEEEPLAEPEDDVEAPISEAANSEAPVREAARQEAARQEERKEPVFVLAFTDYYRYTRSGSIRAIDRYIHEGGERARIGFPRLGPGVSHGETLVSEGSAYTAGFFMSVNAPEGSIISYNLDNRGRVTGEVWKDENGKILGELKNTWSGDRLQSVSWKTANEERLIEYEYDRAGNPTVERNFRNGVLERSVSFEDNRETEEIYMNGRLILRAYWENGLKIMEERVFSTGDASTGGGSTRGNSQ